MRFRELGGTIGHWPPGPNNAITDVAGIRVGQSSVQTDSPFVTRSGATVIWPHSGNPDVQRVFAGVDILNGYGEMTGRTTIEEWGLLGSPVVLTNTRSVGQGYEAVIQFMNAMDPRVGNFDVLMPVVAECDDGYLNDNRGPAVPLAIFEQALREADSGPVAEGSVGAGYGMQLFGFKGGIGTSSRKVEIAGSLYTIGVLVNTNFGRKHQLIIQGHPIGLTLPGALPLKPDKEGSCIGIVATDAPLLPHQLRRLAKRVGFGLVRTGSVGNDGSGELFLAFSTAAQIPKQDSSSLRLIYLNDGLIWDEEPPMNGLFEATVEASEEAVMNALVAATTVYGRDGHVLQAFPVESYRRIFETEKPEQHH